MDVFSCPFCAFIHGDAEKPRIYVDRGAGVVSFVPLNPVTPGHMLFVPKVHVEDAMVSPVIAMDVAYEVFSWAHAKGGQWNFITSAGAAATQTVFHMHMHAVPRRENDGLKLPWTEQHNGHILGEH